MAATPKKSAAMAAACSVRDAFAIMFALLLLLLLGGYSRGRSISMPHLSSTSLAAAAASSLAALPSLSGDAQPHVFLAASSPPSPAAAAAAEPSVRAHELASLKATNEELLRRVQQAEAKLATRRAEQLRATSGAAAAPAPNAHAEARAIAARSCANVSGNPHRLTDELIRVRCDAHNIILVTFVNAKRADYAYTWDAHVRRLQLRNYLIGAMDGAALKLLLGRSIPTFDMESGLTTSDYGWGTKTFRQLGLRKCELIIRLLRANANPILTDADALILRDPSPYVLRYRPEAQILVTSDHLSSTSHDGGLEDPAKAYSAWNIGFLYLHHSTLPAMLHWQAMCIAHPTLWDQNLFKDTLKLGGLHMRNPHRPELQPKRLFLGYNRSVAIGILPVSTFASGHTYFVQRLAERAGVEPYSVHTTFQYSGAPGKTHRLREARLWHDEPAYYDPPGQRGLIVYAHAVERRLLRPAGVMDVASHFELMNAQLRQLRAAFLLAKRLDRILVLPRLACGLDRFWAPHNGTIPGAQAGLPVDPCPADHVVDLEAISKRLDLTRLLREYSFLDNPRVGAPLRASIRAAAPPKSLADTDLHPLRELAGTRVLNLTSMPDLFATLPAAEQRTEQAAMRSWTSMWCCSQPEHKRGPGHIHYDMFYDMVPHTDKHLVEWTKPWTPRMGP